MKAVLETYDFSAMVLQQFDKLFVTEDPIELERSQVAWETYYSDRLDVRISFFNVLNSTPIVLA